MLRRARWCHNISSVRLSVTFRYRDHIISRPNILRLMRRLTQTWAIWCNGNTPKLGWNRDGVISTVKPAISTKRCKIGPRLLWRTNRKSHTRFRLVPKSMTLDDLERPKRHSFRNKKYGPHQNKSRTVAGMTARCRCKFRYLSKFTPVFTAIATLSN